MLEQIRVPYKQEWVEGHQMGNYFIWRDLVSRIGIHIGPTFEMIPRSETGAVHELGTLEAHRLESAQRITELCARLRISMPQAETIPPRHFTINQFYASQKDGLLGFGLFLALKIAYLARSSSGSIADFLQRTAGETRVQGIRTPQNLALMIYIQALGRDEVGRLRDRLSPTGKAKSIAHELSVNLEMKSEGHSGAARRDSGFPKKAKISSGSFAEHRKCKLG